MGSAFASGAGPRPAFAAYHFERMLGIKLLSLWNKLATSRAWTEYPQFPWRAELKNTLHKNLLILSIQYRLYNRPRNSLGAALRRHLRLVIRSLCYENMKASAAVVVLAGKGLQLLATFKTIATADAGTIVLESRLE
jgi:hypothetical protein